MFIGLRFYSLRAPEERNVLVVELYAAPTERNNLKLPRAINILLLRSKESPKLKATFCAKQLSHSAILLFCLHETPSNVAQQIQRVCLFWLFGSVCRIGSGIGRCSLRQIVGR
jgi:hypothetical protein